MTGPDGKPAQVSGQSVEVVRRQANGDWLFVIDEPFGVAGQ
jgi:ketosteroid isomerase-like protein